VQNTGTLDEEFLPEGFGLKSTRDRLKFLFQGKADFQIKKINGSEVEAKIIMPISY
jgi:two-component system LytT family sensor kinase